MNLSEIGRLRLHNLLIFQSSFEQATDVVAWLGALQAQDYAGALWSIGMRLTGATEQSIEQAVADRSIVRTWPMRGTLHFVAAVDVRWLLKMLTPRRIKQTASRYRQLELDETTFSKSKEVFVHALQGGHQLTRDELYQHLEQAGIAPTGQRGYHLLVRAAQDGLICCGANLEKAQTFTLLDEWIPPTTVLTRDEALAKLALRYFTSHGPATVQDLARWAGITMTEAKRGVADVQANLQQETVDDQVYWLSPKQPIIDALAQDLYLLPGFDEFMLGYGDRSAVLDPAYAERICPGRNGVFRPTIVSAGSVVGTWTRALKKKKVVISYEPFTTLNKTETDKFAEAAAEYATFLGMSLELK